MEGEYGIMIMPGKHYKDKYTNKVFRPDYCYQKSFSGDTYWVCYNESGQKIELEERMISNDWEILNNNKK